MIKNENNELNTIDIKDIDKMPEDTLNKLKPDINFGDIHKIKTYLLNNKYTINYLVSSLFNKMINISFNSSLSNENLLLLNEKIINYDCDAIHKVKIENNDISKINITNLFFYINHNNLSYRLLMNILYTKFNTNNIKKLLFAFINSININQMNANDTNLFLSLLISCFFHNVYFDDKDNKIILEAINRCILSDNLNIDISGSIYNINDNSKEVYFKYLIYLLASQGKNDCPSNNIHIRDLDYILKSMHNLFIDEGKYWLKNIDINLLLSVLLCLIKLKSNDRLDDKHNYVYFLMNHILNYINGKIIKSKLDLNDTIKLICNNKLISFNNTKYKLYFSNNIRSLNSIIILFYSIFLFKESNDNYKDILGKEATINIIQSLLKTNDDQLNIYKDVLNFNKLIMFKNKLQSLNLSMNEIKNILISKKYPNDKGIELIKLIPSLNTFIKSLIRKTNKIIKEEIFDKR